VVCDRQGNWQHHHPTGTDWNRDYLDPDFTVPLCHDHHTLIHDDWGILGVEEVDEPLDGSEVVALRLRRLAITLARVDGDDLVKSLAATLPGWADLL
jgi:hypothetical protein